ncbi:aminotransferase DegT [Microtetraspora sp. NBRC 13810]|uniref:DegT/DnrJ/EryC1/StrS family aminotransferase n=1 Tax=Microtetraspora sp. NBRC 13810 TaxID=3030990 RepID=UPI0024A20017|nr:DegT/DnrJ/EryC1/StrS family aminotransferase [Microtetraspora sp. NBRC 13810]GLW05851.1 aminotransferase DegT [Microtetraspora sp. NBRC 13810]
MADKLAILGGTPLRQRPWPAWPHVGPADVERLRQVIENRNLGGIPFPNTLHREFVERFTTSLGAPYGLLCTNGSVSISTALRALGVQAGDEVITTSLTWVATASSIVHVNAVPVLVDISDDNWCIDPQKVEEAITDRTRAIVVVHLGNQVADMDALVDIANRHNLFIVEDCAHAHYAEWRGQCVGTIGDAGSFSFETSKIMTSGEGGFLTFKDEERFHRAMSLVHMGHKDAPYDRYEGRVLGWNHRISELQAAVLLGQLDSYAELDAKRTLVAEQLLKGLSEVGGFKLLPDDARVTRRQKYELLVRFDTEAWDGLHRDKVLAALLAEGVEFEGDTFYPPMHRDPLFHVDAKEWPMIRERYGERITADSFHLPVADKVGLDEAVWIHHSLLVVEPEDVQDMLDAVQKLRDNLGELKSLT